jgi:hypothetical protein
MRILEVGHTSGTLLCFEVGDYTHALIQEGEGEPRSFWIGEVAVMYFLATHPGESMVLTYEVRDVFVPEAGERMETESLTEAVHDGRAATAWWREQVAAAGSEEGAMERHDPTFLQAICEF